MSNLKISVVTVCYNQGEFIRENIESVLAQNYSNFEHIIVDGGSTDSTIDVLKSYDHLKWTSKPDRGQTDALNQGFARATGDIIAWLNSDDFYAPGAFEAVAKELQNHSVVLGRCAQTDRAGSVTSIEENVTRNWFDLLKYWVYYSIPAQPSVFFRRDILEDIKLSNGLFLDEELEFGMDYEFWLRVAQHTPFTHRIEQVLSNSRMYEENKTGKTMQAAYLEYGRVFKRYENQVTQSERKVSFVIPISDSLEAALPTIQSIREQRSSDYEVLFVDTTQDDKKARALKHELIGLSEQAHCWFRYLRAEENTGIQSLALGTQQASAPYVVCTKPGVIFDSDFVFEVNNLFQADAIGAVFPLKHNQQKQSELLTEMNQQQVFNMQSLFTTEVLPETFVARKLSLLEVDAFHTNMNPVSALREVLLGIINGGWQIASGVQLGIQGGTENQQETREEYQRLQHFINARLIVEHDEGYQRNPMNQLRAQHGFGVAFSPEVVSASKELLKTAPENFR